VTGERGAAARGWKKSAAARYWKDGARREDKHDARLKKIRSSGSMDENEGTATAGKIFLGWRLRRERERRAGNQERERSVGEGDEDDAERKNIVLLELKIEQSGGVRRMGGQRLPQRAAEGRIKEEVSRTGGMRTSRSERCVDRKQGAVVGRNIRTTGYEHSDGIRPGWRFLFFSFYKESQIFLNCDF
jgi:hypothetical protein